jgi:hypothetical protein
VECASWSKTTQEVKVHSIRVDTVFLPDLLAHVRMSGLNWL